MKNKAFELEYLPDISDTISEKTKQIRQEIIDNYKYIQWIYELFYWDI